MRVGSAVPYVMDWATVRSDFPLLDECVYLNTASASPTPDTVAAAVQPFFEEKARGYLSGGWNDEKQACQSTVAEYLGVRPNELVFVSNTTEAVNNFAAAVDWMPDDEVVITDGNFPSNVYPWQHHSPDGVTLRRVETVDADSPTAAVLESVTPSTRVVAVPHVSAQTGIRLNLDRLGDELENEDVLVFVDGIQAMGYLQPDLTGIDGYAAAAFKWLLGPFGIGVWYLDADTATELTPSMVGYGNVETGSDYGHQQFEFIDSPQKFQYGHANYPGIYCLTAAMEYLDTVGPARIRDRVLDLSGTLIDRLAGLSAITVRTPRDARGAIVSFDHADHAAETVVDRLANRDIHLAARGGSIRASPHFYNTAADIEALITALESF